MDYNFTATGSINGPVLAAVFAVEAVVGFIANIIVLSITLYQRKSFKQPSAIFFTSLILSDLLAVLIYLPMTTVSTGAEEWIFGSTFEQRRATCVFSGIIFWFILYVTTGVLAAISFDKCLFIVKPYFYKGFIKPWVALAITVALWIIIGLMFTLPLINFENYYYYGIYFGPCYVGFLRKIIYSIIFGLWLIFIITIIVTSVWTFCFTRRFINNQSAIGGENAYNSRKMKLFGIFGSMLLAYTLCYAPAVIIGFISFGFALPYEVFATTTVALHFAPIVSPMIQAYFRPEITKSLVSFKNALCEKLRCSHSN
ncbi:PREDICTED: trace amine-associated receptor 7a-like [Amphimedon queenslandica]|uniref:G-protein coupled receptors family 1 profile domain-containing protein n=1 Tax=Amphimedon queenslandica TaxID=400682 RepID=A0AAN0J7W7_AMPQE|nr:PREDICTED: trace amine-associated receptor 7a-like [Amphimedon queenslandica]|eukprot:XP_019853119.1 PREDICTED: trace amine-associated receptor 7a-like [Amphimedon queenslandica]